MWSTVLGQERAKDNLQRALLSGRVAHAYCFWGPEGVGKDAMALELAKCLNCEAPLRSADTIEACGTCRSCLQFSHLQHPNLKLIFALPAGKGSGSDDDSAIGKFSEEQLAQLQEQIQLKAENPYHNVSMANASQIRIASIRELKKSVQLSQSQGGHRVIVFFEAEQMTMEAANAFLKTLEEPQPRVTMILCSSRKDMLPQTILSRCQQIQFDPLSDDDIRAALVERVGMSEQNARLCASLSQGSYSTAMSLQDDDTQQLRNDIVDLLRSAMRGGNYRVDILGKLDALTQNADKGDMERMLSLLMIWIRDAMLIQSGASDVHLINQDQSEILKKFVGAYAQRDYHAALERIEECIRNIRGNGQIHLNLVTLVLSLRQIFLIGS